MHHFRRYFMQVVAAVSLSGVISAASAADNPQVLLKTNMGDMVIELYPDKAPIENEAKNGLKNEAYSVAMARTSDPHSATAQFFINVNNNAFLDYPSRDGWGYAVFGKVVKGTDTVDKIRKVETGNAGMYQNVPLKPVVIESASAIK